MVLALVSTGKTFRSSFVSHRMTFFSSFDLRQKFHISINFRFDPTSLTAAVGADSMKSMTFVNTKSAIERERERER